MPSGSTELPSRGNEAADVTAGNAPRDRAPGDAVVQTGHRLVAGRYRLDAVIGSGAGGTVWAATDQVLRRRVALKKIYIPRDVPPARAEQIRERTLREARTIAALSSPYVITVFDIVPVTETGPVIVMELFQGRSLAKIIRQEGRLSDVRAARIGFAVASGLLAAHAVGVVHRDVKPSNVLVDESGQVKLTDFGIARNLHEHTSTDGGLIVGSPAYLAPEVATGSPAVPASDAWSLGATLFACVEGHPPFDKGTAIDTVTAVVNDPVPPYPHAGALGAVISGLLVKSPSLRMKLTEAIEIMQAIGFAAGSGNDVAVPPVALSAPLPAGAEQAHPFEGTQAGPA